MSDKKDLLQEIKDKVIRKQKLKEEIASRGANIEEFVLKMIHDVETMLDCNGDRNFTYNLALLYQDSFECRIKTVDPGATLTVKWHDVNDGSQLKIDGILITWSKDYQKNNNCEEQLFVDILSLLLK